MEHTVILRMLNHALHVQLEHTVTLRMLKHVPDVQMEEQPTRKEAQVPHNVYVRFCFF